ncbi:hypothetical protein SRHO_G00209380 [Serrasalmus rhombeus]
MFTGGGEICPAWLDTTPPGPDDFRPPEHEGVHVGPLQDGFTTVLQVFIPLLNLTPLQHSDDWQSSEEILALQLPHVLKLLRPSGSDRLILLHQERHDPLQELFGMSGECRSCRSSIPAGEMVMKAKSYMFHIKCFVCSVCCKRLVAGDHFHCENGALFCDQDKPAASEYIKRNLHSSAQDNSVTDQMVKTDYLIDR